MMVVMMMLVVLPYSKMAVYGNCLVKPFVLWNMAMLMISMNWTDDCCCDDDDDDA